MTHPSCADEQLAKLLVRCGTTRRFTSLWLTRTKNMRVGALGMFLVPLEAFHAAGNESNQSAETIDDEGN
jgi:hypothetical protein